MGHDRKKSAPNQQIIEKNFSNDITYLCSFVNYYESDSHPGVYLGAREAVVLGNGAVEEAVVWQDSTQTYRLQLYPNYIFLPL